MPKIDFKIEEFYDEEGKRFVVFIIPAAIGEPTCFTNIPYVRVGNILTELRKQGKIQSNDDKKWILC